MLILPAPRPLGRRVALALGVAAALAACDAVEASGQGRGLPRTAAQSDSIRRLDAVRRAQRAFERQRRAALPLGEVRGQRACEATVGRFCYWHDGDARRPPDAEPVRVTAARRHLLHALDSASLLQPGDRWIIGQRVRYRIDAGDTTGAVRTADRCSRMEWWCPALAGFARHVAGDARGAHAAFETALAAMPASARCVWENPAVLLEPAARARMQALSCAARRRVAERLWWLATPLLSRDADDLRAEFLARHVAALLEADARRVYDTSWSWDTRELLLRYGWPVWWTRERAVTLQGSAAPQLVGHEASPSFNFLPSVRLIDDSTALPAPGDWSPAEPLPSARYAPAYMRSWTPIDAQLVRLIRGDTLLVLAAFDAAQDTLLRTPVAQLVVSAAPGAPRHVSAPSHAHAGALEVRMPLAGLPRIGLASLEIVDSAAQAVARYRTGITAPDRGRIAVSDLLLHRPLDAGVGVPGLVSVMQAALPRLRVTLDRVAFYWETYGVDAGGEMLDVGLELERTRTPWLARAAARVGLATRATPLKIRWRESPGASHGAAARTVTVNLADLAPGEYRVTLAVRADDGSAARTSRLIVVAR